MSESEWASYDIQWSNKPGPKPPTLFQVFGSLAKWIGLAAIVAGMFAGTLFGISRLMASAKQNFHNQMIVEALQQYQIVEQGTDLAAKSMHAGVVAEAFLMAKDSDNYHKWKKVSEDWDALLKRQIEADTMRQFQRLSR